MEILIYMIKRWLFGMTLSELNELVARLGMPKFTAKQIADWLYKKGCADIDMMTNISVTNRARLSEEHCVGLITPSQCELSSDGTKKYLFATSEGKFIESVYIPDGDRATLCVSSQSGCKMGCHFCMTARQGFQHHLSTGEIINQVASIDESDRLTNIVYMGMGEPLDNIDNVLRSLEIMTSDWGYGWSPTRITLSTIGVMPALQRFLDECKVNLAVSLHNPFADERLALMPSQNKHTIADTIKLIKQYDFAHQRRVSFEYLMLDGLTDTPKHAAALAAMLRGIFCRVNLIRFHAIPDAPYRTSDMRTINAFKTALENKGVITTIRSSRGEDISAACGMLSTKES